MRQKILYPKRNQRLVMEKNWTNWLKVFGIWKNKKGPEPIKWQRKIRKDRKLN